MSQEEEHQVILRIGLQASERRTAASYFCEPAQLYQSDERTKSQGSCFQNRPLNVAEVEARLFLRTTKEIHLTDNCHHPPISIPILLQ